jgi:uncharacterized protein YjeT (DUF2065 family)
MSEISVLLGLVVCFEGFLYPLVPQSMHTTITALPTRSLIPVLTVSMLIDQLSSISLLRISQIYSSRLHGTFHHADHRE